MARVKGKTMGLSARTCSTVIGVRYCDLGLRAAAVWFLAARRAKSSWVVPKRAMWARAWAA
ncbi:hypothetical protein D3C85_1652550 [compost metagenome]